MVDWMGSRSRASAGIGIPFAISTTLTVLGEALEGVAHVRAAHQQQRGLQARVLAEVRRHPEDLLGKLPGLECVVLRCGGVVGRSVGIWGGCDETK